MRPERHQVDRRDARRPEVHERMIVGRGCRHERRARLPGGRARDRARLDAGGEHREVADASGAVDARRVPVHLIERAGESIDQPRLPVEVVHAEDAVGRQMRLRRLHRSGREQVALEAEGGLPCQERQRVRQREQDHVVAIGRPLEERPAVGDVHVDARVVVRMLRIELDPQLVEVGVDLDRIDTLRAVGQSDGHIATRSGADDEHPARRMDRALVRREVQRLAHASLRDRFDGLVRDPVDGHQVRAVRDRESRDLVVRRPRRTRRERLRAQHDAERDHRHPHDPARTGQPEHDEADPHHDRPCDRWRPEERQRRERADPDDAPMMSSR